MFGDTLVATALLDRLLHMAASTTESVSPRQYNLPFQCDRPRLCENIDPGDGRRIPFS
jgi:hypothetical protein